MFTGPPPKTLASRSGKSSSSEGSHRYSLPWACWPEFGQHAAPPVQDSDLCAAEEGRGAGQLLQGRLVDQGLHQGHGLARHGVGVGPQISASWLATCCRINDSASTPIRLTVNRVTKTKLATRRQRMEWNMGRDWVIGRLVDGESGLAGQWYVAALASDRRRDQTSRSARGRSPRRVALLAVLTASGSAGMAAAARAARTAARRAACPDRTATGRGRVAVRPGRRAG